MGRSQVATTFKAQPSIFRYSKHFWEIFRRVRDSYISYILKQPALLMLSSPIRLGNQASVPPDCCVEVLKSHVARWSVSPEGGHGK